MYGIDKNLDLGFLIGKNLLQICVGSFQVILNFDANVSISIESTFDCGSEEKSKRAGNLPEAAPSLFHLLGKHIKEVNVESEGTLALTFSDDTIVRIYDSNSASESYQINGLKDNVIV
jgi:hypothetical protein